MRSSRRTLLRGGIVTAAVASMPVSLSGSADGLVPSARPMRLRRRTFTPHVGETFRLSDGEHSFNATLVEVGDHSRQHGSDTRFTLTFRGGGGEQGSYTLVHPMIKPFSLFLVPVGLKPGLFEAVVAA